MASLTDRPDRPGHRDHNAPIRAPAHHRLKAAGPAVAGFAVAVAAGAAIAGLGGFVEDPAAAAEAAYLATLTVLLLASVAALGGRGRHAALLPWSAVAVVTAAWVLPPGPGRGAAVLSLLVASVAAAGICSRPTAPPVPRRDGATQDATLGATLSAAGRLLPLAVAVQVIFRGDDLLRLAPDLQTLVVFVAMPLAAAGTVGLLAVRRGMVPAGIAAATVILWTGGLDVAASVALVALAAGELLREPGRRGLLVRAGAVALLAAPFAWQPRTAAVAAAAGLLMTGGVTAAALVAAAALAALFAFPLFATPFLAPLQSWPEVVALLGLGLLLLPFAPWLVARRVGRRPGDALSYALSYALSVATGLALAVAAARCAPALAGTPGITVPALAAPLALLGLVAAAGPVSRGGRGGPGAALPAAPGLALQQMWSGGLLLVAGIASAYPWLRPDATRSVLGALDLQPQGPAPLVVTTAAILAAGALATLYTLLERRSAHGDPSGAGDPGFGAPATRTSVLTGWATLSTAVAALLILVAQAAPAPPFGRTLVGHPGVLLSAATPRFEADVATLTATPADSDPEIHRLALFGSLVRAEGVADGTPVATLTVLAGDRTLATWPLHAGDDLGEWAARRPAVTAALRHRPPPPWASWLAPDGGYLGQVYRAEHDAAPRRNGQVPPADSPPSGPAAQANAGSPPRLLLERAPGLPPGVQVHVRRVEAWP